VATYTYIQRLGLPEHAMGWLRLGLGLVVEDKLTEFSWCENNQKYFLIIELEILR
jgi:hypothetical protein